MNDHHNNTPRNNHIPRLRTPGSAKAANDEPQPYQDLADLERHIQDSIERPNGVFTVLLVCVVIAICVSLGVMLWQSVLTFQEIQHLRREQLERAEREAVQPRRDPTNAIVLVDVRTPRTSP